MILKPIAVIGAGGHARVVSDLVRVLGRTLAGSFALASANNGLEVLGTDEDLAERGSAWADLTVGVGGPASLRQRIFGHFRVLGFTFVTLRHPSSVVSPDTEIGAGVQIMAGAVLQAGSKVADNVILNTRCSVDHDCVLAASVHVSPGATLCGGVRVGAAAQIGAGAVILPDVRIGSGAVVGAGAVVTREVAPGRVVKGVPARDHL